MSFEIDDDDQYTIGDPGNCQTDAKKRYWIPIKQGQKISGNEFLWIDDRKSKKTNLTGNSKWNQYEPNGLDFEQCVDSVIYNGTEVWNDELCGSLRCSLCKMPISQKYYLRGQGEYDQEYSLSMNLQKNASKIVFEGQGRDQIFWHISESKAEIKRSASETVEFDQSPFGRLISKSNNGPHDWVFTNVRF